MDEKDKEEMRRRYQRAAKKHHVGHDEEKRRQTAAKRRRAQERAKPARPRAWSEDDDTAGFEKIRRGPTPRTDRPAPNAAADGEDAGNGDAAAPGPQRALVIGLTAGRAEVWLDGASRPARLAPALAIHQQTAIAIGDEVLCEESGDLVRVVRVLPRRTALTRPDPTLPARTRVLAANVDVAVVVVAARGDDPRRPLRTGLIDRMSIAIEHGGVRPVVCVNKVDLLDDAARTALTARLEPYVELGVATCVGSAVTGEGLGELRRQIAGATAVFVGPSGVGKSSLLNALDPRGARPTQEVRTRDGKGRHTTTGSTLRELEGGARVIDTPGLRAFGLGDVDRRTLAAWFPEIVAVARACRFRDCAHDHEPDCAVRAAVGNAVPRARYEAYLRIRASL